MKRALLILGAVLGLWVGAVFATVNAMNGVAITTASSILGKTPNSAVIGQTIVAGGGGYTLLYDSVTAGTDEWPFGYQSGSPAARHYTGGYNFTTAGAINLGRVTVKLKKSAGSITGQTFRVRVWTLTGTVLLVNVATSDAITGSDAWSATLVDFTFASPYTTTGGVNYAITIDSGTDDPSNYASAYNVTPQIIPGDLAWWDSTGIQNLAFNTFNLQMKIYTSP